MMMRLSTTPVAGPPIRSLVLASAARMSAVVVSVRSVSMSSPSPPELPRARQARASRLPPESQPPPGAAVAGEHLVGADGPAGTRRILLGLVVTGPVVLDRVEDHPGQLDLFLPGEQRRVAHHDVQQKPLLSFPA